MASMERLPLPDALVAQARSYAEGSATPAEPRDAATVVLLRPGAAGPDVYLLRRQTSMAFAGGMCVFPGGGVDPRDFDAELVDRGLWAGPSPAEWAVRLGVDEPKARALVCAAGRETFEESVVLLAGPGPEEVVADTTGDDWEADRVALESRELSLTSFLETRSLVLRTDLLGAWSGWLTPVFEPRRYRTWFFVARLPEGQVTRDVSTESSSVTWLSAHEAVGQVERQEMLMLPPTWLTCLDVAQHADPDEAAREYAERHGCGVRALDPAHRLGGEGLGEGDVVSVGGLEVHVVATPGHTADSLSFVVPQDRAVLTGDTVLGRGTTVVAHPDGQLGAYLSSLQRLHALCGAEGITTVWPGHGPVIDDALGALELYLAHRQQRLEQVRQAVCDLREGEPVAHDDLPRAVVEVVYADVDPVLWGAAELSVRAQLAYLEDL